MVEYLTGDFLTEIFKLCFLKRSVLSVVAEHLKFQFIPDELVKYKKVLKSIVTYYRLNEKLPSYGYISQLHADDKNVQDLLGEIKECKVVDVQDALESLEDFIRKIRFQMLHDKVADVYGEEGRQNEAMTIMAQESQEIHEFTIKRNTDQFSKLFADFPERVKDRQLANASGIDIHEKIPFGIDPLDKRTYGGMDKGETALWIMRSGVGKSTALKWTALNAALLGYDVLHIQLEGSKKEAEDKYDQVWTKARYNEVKFGDIPDARMTTLDKQRQKLLARKRDLYIYAFEQFDEASMQDVRNLILDYHKIRGKFPGLIVIDYLELLHPGDGIKYGVDTQSIKMKMTNTARKMKNLCLEFEDLRILTATQTGDVHPTIWNDPEKVITRSDTKGDKNLADSFSYVFSGNRTRDEKKKNLMRIYCDKIRNYDSEFTIKIASDYDRGRFYDRTESDKLSGN